MNFRLIIGDNSLSSKPFGDTIYKLNTVILEAENIPILQYENENGTLFCLGSLIKSAKINPQNILKNYLDSKDSLSKISSCLEGRFILFYISQDSVSISADEFGKLDIYYQKNKSHICVASNLDLLTENPSKEGFDQNALAHLLTYYGYCPPKTHTIYTSTRRLGIGEVAEISNGALKIIKNKFIVKKSKKYSNKNHDEYTAIFLDYLKANYSEEGNFIYLSSGWDSTAILAGLIHLFGEKKITCIIGRHLYSTRSGCCNQIEIDKAHKIAEYYGVELKTVDFDLTHNNADYFDGLKAKMMKNQLYAITGFTHDQLAIKTAELAKGSEQVFAGEISDGAHNLGFSQYMTIFHPSHGFREYSDKMASYLFGPTFLSLLVDGEYKNDPIFKLLASMKSDAIFDDIADNQEDIKLQLLTSFFLRNARIPLWSIDNETILTSKGRDGYTKEMQQVYLEDIAEIMDGDSMYSCFLHLYNSFHWQGSTVRSLQTMADNHLLNTDLPYWSSNLQNFLALMPEEWGRGLDLNPTKYPLKNMLKNTIDYPYDLQTGNHSYTYDVEHSFNHSQEIYCFSALTQDFQDCLKDKPYHQILSKEYFDLNLFDNLVDEYTQSAASISLEKLLILVPLISLCYIGWYGKNSS
jgi:hypothetical protein